jgi:hypothetical protein
MAAAEHPAGCTDEATGSGGHAPEGEAKQRTALPLADGTF